MWRKHGGASTADHLNRTASLARQEGDGGRDLAAELRRTPRRELDEGDRQEAEMAMMTTAITRR